MQTRSQTRHLLNAHTHTPVVFTLNIKNSKKSKISISSLRIKVVLNNIKQYITQHTEEKEKCIRKLNVLKLFDYLTSDLDAIEFLNLYPRVAFESLKLLNTFKKANDLADWEADYFIQKFKELLQTKDFPAIWASVFEHETNTIAWINNTGVNIPRYKK